MKIIHLSDPHISPDKLFEHDAKERFSLALQHICNNHLDSKLFVISGDLTHDGDNESYNKLKEILLNSKIPKHLFPKLLMGNHDDREQFKQIFTKIPLDENGFVQYFEDIEDKRFIFLDTNFRSFFVAYVIWIRKSGFSKIQRSGSVFFLSCLEIK